MFLWKFITSVTYFLVFRGILAYFWPFHPYNRWDNLENINVDFCTKKYDWSFVGYISLVTWDVSLCASFLKLFYVQFIYKNTLENLKLNLSTKYHDYWMFGSEVIAGDPNFCILVHFGPFCFIFTFIAGEKNNNNNN